VRRGLVLFLAVLLSSWFAPTAHALTRASAPDAQARYDKSPQIWLVVVDVGITMDTYEGDQEDPLSLHKYLYCQADPIDEFDPLGLAGETDDTAFGRSVERVIRQNFFEKDIAHRGDIQRTLGYLVGLPAKGFWLRQKVDLYNKQSGNNFIYEIKPCTSEKILECYAQLGIYLWTLDKFDKSWRLGEASDYMYWDGMNGSLIKSENGLPLPGGKWALVLPPVNGLITYVKVPRISVFNALYKILALSLATARPVAAPAALETVGASVSSVAAEASGAVGAGVVAGADVGIGVGTTIDLELLEK
jgi:hypothetical protein